MSNDKDTIIKYAIDDLFVPRWQENRIKNRLNKDTEEILINEVVSAVGIILFDYYGLSCEKETRERIDEKIIKLHHDYFVYFEQ